MAKRKKKASKKGSRADRARISVKQRHEVYYVARKFGVSADTWPVPGLVDTRLS
jgi:hypothetical protein